MLEQYTTTDGRTVTAWPDKKLWIVSSKNKERKFFSFTNFMRYMTK